VALVVADVTDESAAKVVRAVQRDGVPRVVLVASRFDEDGVVAAVAAGVTAFLRRADATTARLVEVIRDADEERCRLPEGLLKKAAVAKSELPLAPVDIVDVSGGSAEGAAATITDLRLSSREAEVLRLVADGLDTTEIADHLAYSESTIKGVLAKVMGRLDARNRCHAIALVVREGLI
jgi:DNA-binding NarL/FixJ family response regulator